MSEVNRSISLEEAIEIVSQSMRSQLKKQNLTLFDAAGRILAEPLFSKTDSPPFRRSAMDGYAICSRDYEGKPMPVAGCNDAGIPRVDQLLPGQAVRIMTGGVVPERADVVIRQEAAVICEEGGSQMVSFSGPVREGDNISPVGEDCKAGTMLAPAGSRVDASMLAAAAAGGIDHMVVYEKIEAGIVSTGDELVRPGEKTARGQIYGSSHLYLWRRLEEAGCDIPRDNIYFAGDDPDLIGERISRLIRGGASLIITTGGVSVGRKDYLPDVMRKTGAEILFHGIQIKPGMPTMFSLCSGVPILSLSGNPNSAASIFEILLAPLLAGLHGLKLQRIKGIYPAADSYPKASPSRRILRGLFDGQRVHFSPWQKNGQMAAGIGCNCLIDVPAGSPPIKADDPVSIIMI